MAITPKGIIVHSMSEYFTNNDLVWLKEGDREAKTFRGLPVSEYPERIHAKEWLDYSGLSVHGYIAPDGTWIDGLAVPERAAHAGKSRFGEWDGLNSHFLGFELLVDGLNDYGKFVNRIDNDYPYSEAQLETAAAKCREWMGAYGIPPEHIVAHSEVSGDDVRGAGRGKPDPGKSFDMAAFRDKVQG